MALLERIEQLQPTLRPYATVTADVALAQARRAEEELAAGRSRGPLHGVPVAVKDLCDTRGIPTACGMPLFADRVPDADATVVARLAEAGAVLLGKLQMTEGAMAEHHPDVLPPVNPWDPSRWTGVSSSGSGVATAAGLCTASLGSDTGGSIRFPCAANGLTGVKPTRGRVSRAGVFPLAESLDHVGPMARSARDAAIVLRAIAGRDPRDPTALLDPVPDYEAGLGDGVAGLRIGLPRAYALDGVAPVVAGALESAVAVLAEAGARAVDVPFPAVRPLTEPWVRWVAAEIAVAHEATYPSRADAYGPSLRGLLEAGRALPATELVKVQLASQSFSGHLAAVCEGVDALAVPVLFSPIPPADLVGTPGSPDALHQFLRFTAPFDMSGSPTVTLPCGFDDGGVPIGFQLVGRHLSEGLLLRAAHAFQQRTDWHLRRPPV